jgi:catechol 2,3-dioxygenase-like lactoylglutathione lyase family enzyme
MAATLGAPPGNGRLAPARGQDDHRTMALIPVVKCSRMAASLGFYTQVLDFEAVGVWPSPDDPAYAVLMRDGREMHLSSHAGDGVYGQSLVVRVEDVDALFAAVLARGFIPPDRPESPIHTGPTDQTWGTRDFVVDDPDGNRVVFSQLR